MHRMGLRLVKFKIGLHVTCHTRHQIIIGREFEHLIGRNYFPLLFTPNVIFRIVSMNIHK